MNPKVEQVKECDVDVVVGGRECGVLMVECEGKEV